MYRAGDGLYQWTVWYNTLREGKKSVRARGNCEISPSSGELLPKPWKVTGEGPPPRSRFSHSVFYGTRSDPPLKVTFDPWRLPGPERLFSSPLLPLLLLSDVRLATNACPQRNVRFILYNTLSSGPTYILYYILGLDFDFKWRQSECLWCLRHVNFIFRSSPVPCCASARISNDLEKALNYSFGIFNTIFI